MTHIYAFNGTDQAECRGDEHSDRLTHDPSEVDCPDCLVRIDDVQGVTWGHPL